MKEYHWRENKRPSNHFLSPESVFRDHFFSGNNSLLFTVANVNELLVCFNYWCPHCWRILYCSLVGIPHYVCDKSIKICFSDTSCLTNARPTLLHSPRPIFSLVKHKENSNLNMAIKSRSAFRVLFKGYSLKNSLNGRNCSSVHKDYALIRGKYMRMNFFFSQLLISLKAFMRYAMLIVF